MFLQNNNKVYKEIKNDGWWCILAFLFDITANLNEMANKVFAFEEKLIIYKDEVQKEILCNFPTVIKVKQDGIQKCLLLIENPRYMETKIIEQLAALGFDYEKLFDEFIEFKNVTNLQIIFKEKRQEREYEEFGKLVPENYKTEKKCAQLLLRLFSSSYLCESSYGKMKYAKSVYRNRLTDAHLDHILRVACSNQEPDLAKIVQSLTQYF